MHNSMLFLCAALTARTFAAPTASSAPSPSQALIPGGSSYYSTYRGKEPPYPANVSTQATMNTTSGPPGPDDLLFQNLLAAEWAIYSFYQQGVETFTPEDFTEAGYPNNTWDRIAEIRDNEAGHARIFQDQISNASVKPGLCKYSYPFGNPKSYLEVQVLLEQGSMAFLTGLVLDASLNVSKSALVAIAETESRHNTWALIDVWKTDPFAGPSDTIFPYANQILQTTNMFIVPGSCPQENPPYPLPDQDLPSLNHVTPKASSTQTQPGSNITFEFGTGPAPAFEEGKEYYTVVFHALSNFTVPFDRLTNSSKIPDEIEPGKGMLIFVIADEPGAPTLDSVVAGPLLLSNQPSGAY